MKESFGRGFRYDVSELDSIAHALRNQDIVSGIYRLVFTNGEMYVGQSVNVIRRFASHRRRWADIVAIEFWPLTADALDQAERELISATEQLATVRNIRDTALPRGHEDWEFRSSEGDSSLLPWDRARRPRITERLQSKDELRFAELSRHPRYAEIRELAGWYLEKLIPDPKSTQRYLWVISCLPSTSKRSGYRRLLVISCGNLETLIIDEHTVDGQVFVEARINTDILEDDPELVESNPELLDVYDYKYRITTARGWTFNIDYLCRIIMGEESLPEFEAMLDRAYHLNVRMMRAGGTMYSRFHNRPLAADVLNAALMDWD